MFGENTLREPISRYDRRLDRPSCRNQCPGQALERAHGELELARPTIFQSWVGHKDPVKERANMTRR